MSRAATIAGFLLLLATSARADILLPYYADPLATPGRRIATGALVVALGAGVIWWRRRRARRPPPPQL